MMELSIVIPTHNTRGLLRDALQGVVADCDRLSYELIVIDNGSSDGTDEMVQSEFPSVRLIRLETNTGYAKACNTGIRASTGRWVVFLNSDTLVVPGLFRGLLNFANECPKDVAWIGPKILNPDRTHQPSAFNFPSLAREFLHANPSLRRAVLWAFPGAVKRSNRSLSSLQEAVPMDRVVSAMFAVRRIALDKVGLFDEGYPFYHEDSDLCYRVRKAGYRILYYPRVELIHYGGGTSGQQLGRREAANPFLVFANRGILRFFHKHYHPAIAFCLRLIIFQGFGLQWLLTAIGLLLPPYSLARAKTALDSLRVYAQIVKLAATYDHSN